MNAIERNRRSEARRNRLRNRLSSVATATSETILFFSAPHIHPLPTAISIERQVSRARAIINKIGATSGAAYNPYQGINLQ